MPDSIKLPPWLGTAVAAITLLVGLVASYADNRAHIAVLEQRVVSLEAANALLVADTTAVEVVIHGREKRLAKLELMVCLIGSHLSVPGLTSSDCRDGI